VPTLAEITEYAPAKLNLFLRVVGRRADGYHCIDSVMVPVSLCDRVRVAFHERTEGSPRVKLCVRGTTSGVPRGQGNLAVRAAHAFLIAAGRRGTVSILLEKAIPPASGLGGGSSDAAAVLLGCAEPRRGRPVLSEESARSCGRHWRDRAAVPRHGTRLVRRGRAPAGRLNSRCLPGASVDNEGGGK
jgi:hypothetical protein